MSHNFFCNSTLLLYLLFIQRNQLIKHYIMVDDEQLLVREKLDGFPLGRMRLTTKEVDKVVFELVLLFQFVHSQMLLQGTESDWESSGLYGGCDTVDRCSFSKM
ncbi:hypothetical protein KIN20_002818 [Parelaphostrongylus tenuis]|uniref:Uncharacterized protein n=1 Tax=Parelaphostrongylus tenuis TaxID=148309 RepID=A0AAD5MER6_PARTN|nr:hypothetical protein KIN20_002818 [Parelaphostrongylus tenuis]